MAAEIGALVLAVVMVVLVVVVAGLDPSAGVAGAAVRDGADAACAGSLFSYSACAVPGGDILLER